MITCIGEPEAWDLVIRQRLATFAITLSGVRATVADGALDGLM